MICELHVNKALKKNLPETYQNLPKIPVVVGSRIISMLEDEEQIVVNF